MFQILLLLFTVVPAVEIFLLFSIGGEIGAFNTFMIVIITGFLGAALAKSQGLQILQKLQTQMQSGELPTDQIIQGLMVFAGGLLLLTPGFMTDIFGFCLVMPGPRHILMIWVKKMVEKSIKSGNVQFFRMGSMGAQGTTFHYTQSTQDDFRSNQVIDDDNIIEADFKHKD